MQIAETCSIVEEKTNILDLNGCVYLLIKHIIDLRLLLQPLFSPAGVKLSSRVDTFCLGLDSCIAWCSAALQQDVLSVVEKYRLLRNVMQLTCTPWMQSDNTIYDGIEKTHTRELLSKYLFLSILHYRLSTGRHLLGVSLQQTQTNIKQSANRTEYVTVERIMLDAQNWSALQSSVLYLEYMVTGHKQITQSFPRVNHRTSQLQISQSKSVRSLQSDYTNETCILIRNCEISIKHFRNLK